MEKSPEEWDNASWSLLHQLLLPCLRKLGSTAALQQTKHSPEPQQPEKASALLRFCLQSTQCRDCYEECTVLSSLSSSGSAKRRPIWGCCCADGAEAVRPKLLAKDLKGGRWHLVGCNFLFDHQTPLSCLGCMQLWQPHLHRTHCSQCHTSESRNGKRSTEVWEVVYITHYAEMDEKQLKHGKTEKIQLTALTELLQSTIKKMAGVSWTLWAGDISAPFFQVPGSSLPPCCPLPYCWYKILCAALQWNRSGTDTS